MKMIIMIVAACGGVAAGLLMPVGGRDTATISEVPLLSERGFSGSVAAVVEDGHGEADGPLSLTLKPVRITTAKNGREILDIKLSIATQFDKPRAVRYSFEFIRRLRFTHEGPGGKSSYEPVVKPVVSDVVKARAGKVVVASFSAAPPMDGLYMVRVHVAAKDAASAGTMMFLSVVGRQIRGVDMGVWYGAGLSLSELAKYDRGKGGARKSGASRSRRAARAVPLQGLNKRIRVRKGEPVRGF